MDAVVGGGGGAGSYVVAGGGGGALRAVVGYGSGLGTVVGGGGALEPVVGKYASPKPASPIANRGRTRFLLEARRRRVIRALQVDVRVAAPSAFAAVAEAEGNTLIFECD